MRRLNLSLTEPLADPGIVIAEPHEANRIVVGQLVEAFLFAFEFEPTIASSDSSVRP